MRRAFTHGGSFHSDDVFSSALLKMIYPEIEIIRGFEVPENFDGIVFDIGGGKFDHHQADARMRENGMPYAAFGLLWEEYGPMLLEGKDVKGFDEEFIQDMDYSDNTGAKNMVAYIISNFNPNWDSDIDLREAFDQAVDVAYQILEKFFDKYESVNKANKIVQKAIDRTKGDILILEQGLPWKDAIKDKDINFAVYPSNRGGYAAQCAPDKENEGKLKIPFPEEWRGKSQEELVEMTGLESIRFCHKNGFLLTVDKKDDAIKACELAKKILLINKKKVKHI